MPLNKENDNTKKITYKLKSKCSYRFTSTSLSNLVDNLPGVYDKECRRCMERKKIGWIVNLLDLKMVDWIINAKNAKKSYTKLANESIKNFPTLYKFCNGDLDKFFSANKKGYLSLWIYG